MKDITNRKDITYLVEEFYNHALKDPQIGPVFKAADFSLAQHIPVMVSFWETILLDVVTYQGNPMLKHIALNQTVPLKPEHFKRWMEIWENSINEKFNGPVAEQAINRARSIASLMQHKIQVSNAGL